MKNRKARDVFTSKDTKGNTKEGRFHYSHLWSRRRRSRWNKPLRNGVNNRLPRLPSQRNWITNQRRRTLLWIRNNTLQEKKETGKLKEQKSPETSLGSFSKTIDVKGFNRHPNNRIRHPLQRKRNPKPDCLLLKESLPKPKKKHNTKRRTKTTKRRKEN